MVSHWSDCKSPQISRTLLSILANLNNAAVWMVSTRFLISKSSSPFTNPLGIVSTAPTTICITVTFMFHSFSVLWQGPGTYFSFRFLSVLSSGQPERHMYTSSVFFFVFFVFFCFFFCLSQGQVFWSRWGDTLVSQNPREVCASHFPGWIPGCAYTICS